MTTARAKHPSPGDLIALPVRSRGYGVVICAKIDNNPRQKYQNVYYYAFKNVFPDWPTLAQVSQLTHDDLLTFAWTSDRCVIDGGWRILGQHPKYTPEDWPVLPVLRARKLAFYDDDVMGLTHLPQDVVAPEDRHHFAIPDCGLNANGLEARIDRALTNLENNTPNDDLVLSRDFALTREQVEVYKRYLPEFTRLLEIERRKKARNAKRRAARASARKSVAKTAKGTKTPKSGSRRRSTDD